MGGSAAAATLLHCAGRFPVARIGREGRGCCTPAAPRIFVDAMLTAAACGVGAAAIVGAIVFGFVKFNEWVGREIDRIATEEAREERGHYGEG
jgi:hypothetical protein